ncbi:pyridoxal phosphate-dependent decarboxylase family protein [Empedobacter brevis]|uniref:pyridoxal phosphate-dependent decarboxylase family protein n=1 Tax=Empedobacter brevis TaxID=247 RepID=UPI0039AFB702
MNSLLQNDHDNLEALLQLSKEYSFNFLKNIDKRPTSSKDEFVECVNQLSKEGIGGEASLNEFIQRFESIIVSSTGPRYLGFVTGGSTPASIVGDWLATIFDQNTQAVKGYGDISANVELETIQLLLDLFNLPKDFLGGFVTGATMSNFTCLAIAKQWLGKELGKDFARDGITEQVTVMSATPHSSSIKSLAMLGIGSNNLIKIKTAEGNREAIDIDDLERQIKKIEGKPFILISSAGTVNTVDFDDFEQIKNLKEKYNFWWHIDAAFGGFAACSSHFKQLVSGWEYADSITIDGHKWLNVPYDNAFFFVKEKYKLLQVESFQNSNAPYLGDPLDNFNYLNFLPENSRRLRALPVWFTLKAYGTKGYQDIVDNSIQLSKQFGQFITENNSLELLAPVRLNTVCFSLMGDENQEKVEEFLSRINDSHKVFMTPTVYNGRKGIRTAFVNWRTTESDLEIIKQVILETIPAVK